MLSSDLYQAVARATGEDTSLIATFGFSLLDEDDDLDDELQEPFLDWDDLLKAD